jgi:hypothetical protein
MTEEQQAAAVEGALAGDVQCAECKQWFNPHTVGFWIKPSFTCEPCWGSLDQDAKQARFLAAGMRWWPRRPLRSGIPQPALRTP